jgi:hypothetical protein
VETPTTERCITWKKITRPSPDDSFDAAEYWIHFHDGGDPVFVNACIRVNFPGDEHFPPVYAVTVCGKHVGYYDGDLDGAKQFALEKLEKVIQKAESTIARYRDWKNAKPVDPPHQRGGV